MFASIVIEHPFLCACVVAAFIPRPSQDDGITVLGRFCTFLTIWFLFSTASK